MKNLYTIRHLPLLSFYSKRLYRDVSVRWKGTNLGFLCILLALCLLPATREANTVIDRYAAIYLMQIPPIRIIHGHVSAEAPQPYSIIEGNHTVLLIDTTGRFKHVEDADALALLTATNLQIKRRNKPPKIHDLSSVEDFELNQEIAAEFLRRMKRFLLPTYYVVSLLFTTAMFLLITMLCGAIALLFGQIQKRQVDYTAGLRLAVTALTPPLILNTLFRAAGLSIPIILYILLALAYLYLAVGACRKAPPVVG